FFQAEDGIRDRTVTGVQTCALPILVGAIEDRILAFRRVASRDTRGMVVAIASASRDIDAVNFVTTDREWQRARVRKVIWATSSQIGRASCRERGEIWEGAGAVESRK